MQRSKKTSLNHLVGASQESGWNFEAKRFCGRQIDNEIKLYRLFDRNIARFRPTQNFVDVVDAAPERRRRS